MRELIVMNKKEKRARISVLRAVIRDDKKLVSREIRNHRKIAGKIRKARIRLEAAERSYERRESKRNVSRIRSSTADCAAFMEAYNASRLKIVKLLANVRRDYISLSDLFGDRVADLIMNRCENYNDSVIWRMINAQLRANITENIELEEY